MKKTNLVLGFMLIMLLAMSTSLMAQTYSGGSGTSGDPYQIGNKTDLKYLSENSGEWVKYFKQTADINFIASDFESDGAFYNGGAGFIPIGNNTTKFTGNYNGQGHTIDALFIDRSSTDYISLFGRTDGSTIENIGLTNVNITGQNHVGGLVGYNYNSSTVSNSYSTGSVSGSKDYIGGLVGYNTISSTVSNSYSTGSVSGYVKVGGLVGYNWASSTVSNSYSIGSVSGTNGVGGLVGYNTTSSTVSNSYSTGDVTRRSGLQTNSGGFCGYNSSATVEYCYSIGSVFYTGVGDPTDKGFVGLDNSGTYTNNFWDSEASNQDTGPEAYATGKSTAEMKTQATFTNSSWDFVGESTNGNDDIWEIIGTNYPRLAGNPDQSLPVELTSYTVRQEKNSVVLEWRTGSEQENLGFIIERKDNENEFTEIASYSNNEELKGAGNSSVRSNYKFTDNNIVSGTTYEYRISDVDYSGKVKILKTITINITENSTDIPKTYALNSAYPNPFNPVTTISYDLPNSSFVTISIYDINGSIVENLVNENEEAGSYTIKWNASNRSSGIYFYRLTARDFVSTKKLVLLK